MIIPLGVTVAAGAVLGGSLLALDRIALGLIRPPYKPLKKRVSDLPFPSEQVEFPSGREVLRGWVLYPEKDNGGPVLVLVHGWGSSHGRMTRLAGPLLESGYPVLLFDVRHHGESRGAPYVTARHFRDDILAAVEQAASTFPGRSRVLIGHSMGGATSVLAVATGAPVVGLVSIGAPADLWGVWADHMDRRGLPGRWVIRLLRPFWQLRARTPWRLLDPRRRARDVGVPFLVLHGDRDESVPSPHAHLLSRPGRVEARILEGWGHSDLLESPELHQEIHSFLKGLPPNPG